jgi:ribose 5-phosphate isomerase B
MSIKVGIASDHAGAELKQLVGDFVRMNNYEVVDYGPAVDAKASVDYPDYAAMLATDVSSGKIARGIAICGTGLGMSIAANKFPGVRAALVWDEFSCRMSRSHNDANVLCLGARTLNPHRAIDFVKIWLETKFEEGRHAVRLGKIRQIEQKNFQNRK